MKGYVNEFLLKDLDGPKCHGKLNESEKFDCTNQSTTTSLYSKHLEARS